MSLDPHNLLKNVHEDLVKVLEEAFQSPQPFQVVYGIRTLAAEAQAVATGHSETMHSRHLPDSKYSNLAMAVDVAALTSGTLNWAPGHEEVVFGQIAEQVLASAQILSVKVQWGGAKIGAWTDGVVSNFRDWGHFQLDPSSYP